MKKLLLATLAVVIAFTSCKTGSEFTSRRYTKGHYASKSYRKDKLKAVDQSKEVMNAVASTKKEVAIAKPAGTIVLEKENKSEIAVLTKKENKSPFKAIKQAFVTKKNVKENIAFAPLLITKKSQNSTVTQKMAPSEGARFDVGALLGMIFGLLGLALGSVGFSIFGLTAIYFVFFVLGLVFGILGLAFGAKGMSRYKENKHWSSLVFGIIGLVTGIFSMILALYYAVVTIIYLIVA